MVLEKVCLQCLKEFKRYVSKSTCIGRGKYCSSICRRLYERNHSKKYCTCGKTKSETAKQCSSCAGLGQRIRITLSNEQIREAIKHSNCFKDVQLYIKENFLLVLSRFQVRNMMKKSKFDTSHFKQHRTRLLNNEQLFTNNITPFSVTRFVRKTIIRDKLLPYKCECGNEGIWQGKSITLELHHIDGEPSHNKIENLKFLCPNCHSQTYNFKGRNVKSKLGRIKIERKRKEIYG
jgi:Zn finger protein HypA/HybF involved in hydrogenase expression